MSVRVKSFFFIDQMIYLDLEVANFRNSLWGIGGFGSVDDRHGSEVGSCPISPGIPRNDSARVEVSNLQT